MLFAESEVVELKAEIVGDICKEVIAFANTKGGTLYIGVSNDGNIVGVENADRVTLQLNNMIRDSIKPDVTMFVHYDTQRIADKDIVAVTIQKGTDRPYYLSSKGLKPPVFCRSRHGYAAPGPQRQKPGPCSRSVAFRLRRNRAGRSLPPLGATCSLPHFRFAQMWPRARTPALSLSLIHI